MRWTQTFDEALCHFFFQVAADTLNHCLIVGFNQCHSSPFLTRTGSTADTVQVHVCGTWHVEVDHMAHVWQVDTTCRNVSGQHHIYFAFTETANGVVTRYLCHLTLDPAARYVHRSQLITQGRQTLTGLHEDDSAFCFAFQDVFQQCQLVCHVVTTVVVLVDLLALTTWRLSIHFNRLVQDLG